MESNGPRVCFVAHVVSSNQFVTWNHEVSPTWGAPTPSTHDPCLHAGDPAKFQIVGEMIQFD